MGKTFRRGSDNNNFRKLKREDFNKSKKLKKFLDKTKQPQHIRPNVDIGNNLDDIKND